MITARAFAGKHYAVYGLARSGLATAGNKRLGVAHPGRGPRAPQTPRVGGVAIDGDRGGIYGVIRNDVVLLRPTGPVRLPS